MMLKTELNICSRCIYDERVASIQFDSNGICNYCHQLEELSNLYSTGTPVGQKKWYDLVDEIKISGRGKKYDCIVGVSGGKDSIAQVHYLIKSNLRVLALHVDNGFKTSIGKKNLNCQAAIILMVIILLKNCQKN